jgi:hypothetical protein
MKRVRETERYTATVPVFVNEYAYSKLTKRFNVAHHIYNCFLGECEKRKRKYLANSNYKLAMDLM